MSEVNTQAEGLEVVLWRVDARFKCPPGSVSGGGVSGHRDTEAGASGWAQILRDYEKTETVTVEPLVRLSDAQQWRDRALAAEGREAALLDAMARQIARAALTPEPDHGARTEGEG